MEKLPIKTCFILKEICKRSRRSKANKCRIWTIINYLNLLLQLEVTITINTTGNHNQSFTSCTYEENNPFDLFATTMCEDKNIVGHLPIEVSRALK